MGRPKKPLTQHKREGTYRKHRHEGPEPESVKPGDGDGLEGVALDTWNKISPVLTGMGVYTEADELALHMLCESYGFYVDASKDIKENGRYKIQVNKTGNEYYIENPSVKARGRFWREVVDLARQFGLTPSARTGLSVIKVEEKKPSALESILRGGRN